LIIHTNRIKYLISADIAIIMAQATSLDIERWRSRFPSISEEGIKHFDHAFTSPVPKRGLEARREAERVWIEEEKPWETWIDKVDEARERFADIIGADSADEIAIASNASQTFAQVASAFYYEDRDEVVHADLEFPTAIQFWDAQRRNCGATVKVAESPDGKRVPAEVYDEQITSDTALVSTSHAYSATGGLSNPDAIADLAHDRGAYFFLDAYQSVGVVPIDVEKQNIDMLCGGPFKFMWGGPGLVFLYVDNDIADDLQPANQGWFGSEERFAIERENIEFAEGAMRFELGTPPMTIAYEACAGMSLIQELGVERIQKRVDELTGQLIEGAEERGFDTLTPKNPEHRTAMVTVEVKNVEEAFEKLTDDGFNMTKIAGLRLAPHFYTKESEVEAVLDAIEEYGVPGEPGVEEEDEGDKAEGEEADAEASQTAEAQD
jgi:selenocysteine lyase/cysteine desulfurase